MVLRVTPTVFLSLKVFSLCGLFKNLISLLFEQLVGEELILHPSVK